MSTNNMQDKMTMTRRLDIPEAFPSFPLNTFFLATALEEIKG